MSFDCENTQIYKQCDFYSTYIGNEKGNTRSTTLIYTIYNKVKKQNQSYSNVGKRNQRSIDV